MAIEFDIKTAEGVSNLDRLTKAWDRNRDRVNTATAAYERQTQRLGRSILENQKLTMSLSALKGKYTELQEKTAGLTTSLNTLEGEYTQLQKKTSGLSTTTKVLGNRVKILEAELSLLTAEMSKLSAANSKVNASTAKTVKSQTQLRSAFRGTAGALGGLWLAYGDILPMMAAFATASTAKAAITQGAAFSYTTKYLTELNREAGDTTVSLASLESKLLGMQALRHTPGELAEGMKSFAKAGVESSAALEDLAEMSRFATLAEVELSYAIEKNIGVANAFGETYADTANMVFAASTSSATNVKDMMTAISQSTSLGVVAGLKLKDTLAALAAAAKSGIFGSKAGTSIKTSILRLQKPSEKFKKTLAELHQEFSAFNKDGSPKNLIDLFSELARVLENLSDEDKTKLLVEGLGFRAIKGGAAVLRELNNGLAGLVDHIGKAAEGVTLLQRVYKGLSEETVSKWERLKNVWSGLLIQMGDSSLVSGAIGYVTDAILGLEAIPAKLSGDTVRLAELQASYNGEVLTTAERLDILNEKRKKLVKELENEKLLELAVGESQVMFLKEKLAALDKEIQKYRALKEAKTKAADVKSGFSGDLPTEAGKDRPSIEPQGKIKHIKLDEVQEYLLKKKKEAHDKRMKMLKAEAKEGRKNLAQELRAEDALQTKREQTSLKLSRLHMSDKELALSNLKEKFDKETEYMDHTSILYQQLSEIYRYEADEIKGINFDLVKELKNHWDDFSDSLKSSLREGLSQSFKVLASGSNKYEQQLATIQEKIHQMQYESLSSGVEQMAFLQREYDTTLSAAMSGSESALQQYMDNLDTYLSKAKEEMDPQEYTQIYDQAMQDLDALNKEYSDNTKAKWAELKEVWGDLWDSMLDKLVDTLADMAVSWAASQVSSMFSGWKFHDGLWNLEDDELPAILQKGEMVIPATHAEQIRENLMGIGNGTGNVFDAVVAGTSLMDLTGWEDEFSDHLSSAYKDDYVAAALGTLASGSPLTGLLSFLGPQVGIQNTGQALAMTGLDIMGIHGSWSDAGFMIGSVLSTMMMGGPLASVTGLNNLGGFVGAIAADMIGGFLDAREFEAVRDELEENFNLTPSQQAQAVQSMEAFQAEWGRLSPVQSLATNISMMSSFTGANLGLNDLLDSEKEARREELARAREDREQALREYSSYYEDTFGETYSGYYAPPGYTESKIDDALDDFFDEIDSISEGSSEGPGVGETGGGTPDHEPGGSFGMASGGVVDRLLVPRGEDGYMALQYGEGVVPRDTMVKLGKFLDSQDLLNMLHKPVIGSLSVPQPAQEKVEQPQPPQTVIVPSPSTSLATPASDIFSELRADEIKDAESQLKDLYSGIKDAARVVHESGMSELELGLEGITDKYSDLISKAQELGASEEDLFLLRRAQEIELTEVITAENEKRREELASALRSAYDMEKTLIDEQLESRIASVRSNYDDRLAAVGKEYERRVSSLNSSLDTVRKSLEAINGVVSATTSFTGSFLSELSPKSQQGLSSALSDVGKYTGIIQRGGSVSEDTLSTTLDVLRSINRSSFASEEDYKRQAWKQYYAVAELESVATSRQEGLTSTEASIEDQIEAAKKNNDLLIDSLNDERDSIIATISKDAEDKKEQLDLQYEATVGIKRDTRSIEEVEREYLAVATSSQETQADMVNKLQENTLALQEGLAKVIAAIEVGNVAQVKAAKDSVKVLQKWDINGMPEVAT